MSRQWKRVIVIGISSSIAALFDLFLPGRNPIRTYIIVSLLIIWLIFLDLKVFKD